MCYAWSMIMPMPLATLDHYDHGTLSLGETTGTTLRTIDYEEGIGLVKAMKGGI